MLMSTREAFGVPNRVRLGGRAVWGLRVGVLVRGDAALRFGVETGRVWKSRREVTVRGVCCVGRVGRALVKIILSGIISIVCY